MVTIKTDSRKIKPGDTFVALPGIESNGDQYIDSAINNGATRIIASHGSYSVDTVIVEDTRDYLNKLLREEYGHILDDMKIIGITGTNGKTTVSYLIYQLLNKLNIKCAYIGTIGYYLDKKVCNLPNTSVDIADLYDLLVNAYDNGYKCVALEVSSQGMSMGRFNNIPFDIGVFTNLTQDHLDYHKTMENYALAKQQLFKQLKKGGLALINCDDKYKDYYLLDDNKNIRYGLKNGDYRIIDYTMNNIETKLNYSYKDEKYSIETSLIGEYNLYNLLACISIVHELGIPFSNINKFVSKLNTPDGRMDKVIYKTNSIIVDYAHTPDAIDNIIKTVKKITKGNIYVVFGCTGDRDRTKRPIMTKLVLENCAKAIITIDDLHNEDPNRIIDDMLLNNKLVNYEVCLDRGKAIHKAIDLLDTNDTLLILGKGHEDAIIIKDKRVPFNDKKVVLEYLDKVGINN